MPQETNLCDILVDDALPDQLDACHLVEILRTVLTTFDPTAIARPETDKTESAGGADTRE